MHVFPPFQSAIAPTPLEINLRTNIYFQKPVLWPICIKYNFFKMPFKQKSGLLWDFVLIYTLNYIEVHWMGHLVLTGLKNILSVTLRSP